MNNRLIIFTRYPIPGKTKTRLIPALGEQGAADLQRAMTEHTIDTIRPLAEEGISIEVRYEGGDETLMGQWLGGDFSLLPQGEGDLGDRMERAFRESLDSGAGKTVIVGTDCPDLSTGDVMEALNLLGSNPVVLGPSADGGYYLIGIKAGSSERLYEALFSGIPWGTGAVFSETVNALAEAGIGLGLLDEKADVDEPEDFIHWEKAVRTEGRGRRAEEVSESRNKPKSRAMSSIPSTASISVIIPTLNEEDVIGETIERLKESGVEVVVADGGSTDGTAEICRRKGVKVVMSGSGRAVQMNAGAMEASGQIFLFLHADTILPFRFEEIVRGVVAGGAAAGAFSFGTDLRTTSMRFIEKMSNVRARRLGIVFGDQAIFARSDIFEKIGEFPELPIMEDMELVRALKRQGRFVLLPQKVVSSSRRWQANSVWKTTLTNQAVMWLYILGASPEKLVKWYGNRLNK